MGGRGVNGSEDATLSLHKGNEGQREEGTTTIKGPDTRVGKEKGSGGGSDLRLHAEPPPKVSFFKPVRSTGTHSLVIYIVLSS